MPMNEFSVGVGGEAGEGILSTGEIFAELAAHLGLHVYTTQTYPSRIRGGHNAYHVRVGPRPLLSQGDGVNLLVAFDAETVKRHWRDVLPGGGIIYDQDRVPAVREIAPDARVALYSVPMVRMAREEGGQEVMKNMVALGTIGGLLGLDLTVLSGIIERRFARKGGEVQAKNVRAVSLGWRHAKEQLTKRDDCRMERIVGEERMLLTGNEAIGLGALVAGCRFVAAYPITPASDILEWMATRLRQYGGTTVQAEDEIAAVNMAIGASFAGVRAMTATSGPGFSLMMESIGLASMTETPLVIVDCQRAGPSTGMPTKQEQSDLLQMLYGSHGESPRIVLAPSTVEDAFYRTIKAFNLAERYQCPIILASDQSLSQRKQTIPPLDPARVAIDRGELIDDGGSPVGGAYGRYAETPSGVSPRAIPGVPGHFFHANSTEHTPEGHATDDPAARVRMVDKRARKLRFVAAEMEPPLRKGNGAAGFTLIGWGSTEEVIDEALGQLAAEGFEGDHIHLRDVWPFPEERMRELLREAPRPIVVENNSTGQVADLVQWATGCRPARILKYDGRPFPPGEIRARVKEVLANGHGDADR